MRKFSVYMRVFEHPAIWLAVVTLLVNDHVLKAMIPSAITGKLSNFAGLFFFPFLLAVSVAWMPFAKRFAAARVMGISIAATGIAFAAIKTVPAVNGFVVDGLSRLTGIPFQLGLDPTDLVGLVMLGPAWWLWKTMNSPSTRRAPRHIGLLGLLLASVATIATSPCPPEYSITRLVSFDGLVYASGLSRNEGAYVSDDGGRSWSWTKETPPTVMQELSHQRNYPMVQCRPNDPLVCYRVLGQPYVEASNDGGETWDMAWEIPKGRYRYTEQAASEPAPLGCGKKLDSRAYDLTFTQVAGNDVLVVAMGNEGVLAYSDAAGWERLAVNQQISPTPFSAKDLRDAENVIFIESTLGTIAGFLAFLGLSSWTWKLSFRIIPDKIVRRDNGIAWAIRPIGLAAAWFVVVFILPFVLRPAPWLNYSLIGMVAWPFVLLVCILWIWIRVGSRVIHRRSFALSGLTCVAAGLGIVTLVNGLFSLWALGTIVYYEVALALTLIFSFLIIILAVYRIPRLIAKPQAGDPAKE